MATGAADNSCGADCLLQELGWPAGRPGLAGESARGIAPFRHAGEASPTQKIGGSMASFKSVLSAIGHFMAKAFSPNAIKVEASIADIALPGFSSLINATASAIINAENA